MEDNLSCWDGLCHIATWVGHRHICVPALLSPSSTSLPTHPPGCHRAVHLGSLCHISKINSIHLLFYNPVCWKSNASLPRLKPRCARRCGSFYGQGEALFLSFPAPRWYPLSFSHNSLPPNFKSAMLHLSDHFFIATSPSGWSQLWQVLWL